MGARLTTNGDHGDHDGDTGRFRVSGEARVREVDPQRSTNPSSSLVGYQPTAFSRHIGYSKPKKP